MKLQMVTNKLWVKEVSTEITNQALQEAIKRVAQSDKIYKQPYCIFFPIFIAKGGRPLKCVVLMSKICDKLNCYKFDLNPCADHVIFLLMFDDHNAWSEQCDKFIALFPEQNEDIGSEKIITEM
jgi:hypothetical protein